MADELRLVFIIIGALVLGALLLHGLWTVRKNAGQPKHRYFDEKANDTAEEKADGFDYSSVRISIARKSVKMLGLEDSVQFSCSDVNYIFDLNIPYKYDLIAITEVLDLRSFPTAA
jgi:hypothetical protein